MGLGYLTYMMTSMGKAKKIGKEVLWLAFFYAAICIVFTLLGFLFEKLMGIPWFNRESIVAVSTILFLLMVFIGFESVRIIFAVVFIIAAIFQTVSDYPEIWIYPSALLISLLFASIFS